MGVKTFLRVLGVSIAMSALVGCAEVPQQDVDAAKAAIDQAKTAEAETYAVAEITAAQDSLSSAMTEIETQNGKFALFRNYDKAKTLLQAATQNANTAATAAVANKEKVKAEVQDLMTQSQTALTQAKELLKKAPRGKDTKEALELINNDLTTVETSITDVTNLVNSEKYLAARDQLQAGMQKIQSITDELNAAIEKKKGGKKM